MIAQRTLKRTVCCEGTGLHSGRAVCLALRPAAPNTGVVFVRKDLPKPVWITAEMRAVSASTFATTLEERGVSVGTVEHLLAALAGMEIDNAIVEVDAPELPIMDGSAAPFVSLIRKAGIAEQDESRKYLVVRKSIRVSENGRWIELSPSNRLKVSCTVHFDHPLISRQFYEVSLPGIAFEEEISPARTFGFLSDVAALRSMGYAQGGSLQNAVVVDDYGVLNEEGLRFPDEFVRHKILDLIGDFSLVGHPLVCHVTAHKSGHAMAHHVLRELLSRDECWEIAELPERRMQKVSQVTDPPSDSRQRASL